MLLHLAPRPCHRYVTAVPRYNILPGIPLISTRSSTLCVCLCLSPSRSRKTVALNSFHGPQLDDLTKCAFRCLAIVSRFSNSSRRNSRMAFNDCIIRTCEIPKRVRAWLRKAPFIRARVKISLSLARTFIAIDPNDPSSAPAPSNDYLP